MLTTYTQKIPVFISIIQRINSILLSLGLGLMLASAYLSSSLSFPAPSSLIFPNDPSFPSFPHPQNANVPPGTTNLPIALALPLLSFLHIALSILYTPMILPRIGLHTASYVGLIGGLGSMFGGLAAWGALS